MGIESAATWDREHNTWDGREELFGTVLVFWGTREISPSTLVSFDFLFSLASTLSGNWDGEVVIMGDFNEVRDISERFGSIFNKHGAEAFNSFIVNAGLVEVPLGGCSFTCKFINKLKYLKEKIQIWARLHKESLNSRKSILKAKLADLDEVIDKGEGSDTDGHRRREVVWLIQEVENVDAMEVAQKAKIKWTIEGDENSKYYHGVLNKKRGRLTIRGVLVDAPGPDGFTFGFYRRYWELLVTMLLMLSNGFFLHGEIPKGGNSSFITLISKVPNVNMVKDFRPISLIGSLYKVIAKVLANRLVTVLDDIVDEIQSAFVTDRQLLDGPFILNEIVHWCKNKMKQSMIFKVDFERRLFNGINLDSSLQISHLLYADDAIFMGQWSHCNIDTIIRVLDVFYRALGLRINMNKSNPMGIFVDSNKVKHAAAKIGCLVLKTLFNYLGSKVGDLMSRIQSWHDVTEGMHTRLSKWKLKTLFIRGRLTLLKSVLGAIAWCGDIAFKNLVPRLYALESMKNIKVASKLSHGGLEFSFRRNPRGGVEQAQFERLKEMVEGVTLSNSNDRWSWFNISRRGIEIESILCPMCECSAESSRHLFFSCKMISDVMRKITHWWDLEYREINSFEDWCQWISSIRLPVKQKHVFEGICYIVWWYTWNRRNLKIFGQEDPSMVNVYDEVVYRSFYWIRFRCKAKFSFIDWLKNPNLVLLGVWPIGLMEFATWVWGKVTWGGRAKVNGYCSGGLGCTGVAVGRGRFWRERELGYCLVCYEVWGNGRNGCCRVASKHGKDKVAKLDGKIMNGVGEMMRSQNKIIKIKKAIFKTKMQINLLKLDKMLKKILRQSKKGDY
nr:RNA-directed DNA polymerase, eukaryota, reverse transcriptase zinc-binding domain protein [Tanacetum cinerariifolium]